MAAAGDFDSSFGMGGVTSLAAGTELDAVAVQADREVVAVGSSGSSLLVQRFSATGASEGAFAAGSGVGRAVVVQPDGKVVVAGNDGSGMVVERFNAGGSLDPGFGSGGVVHAVPGGRAYAVALGPGGTIVAAGQVPGADAFQRIAVLRLSSSGSPVASFGRAACGSWISVRIRWPRVWRCRAMAGSCWPGRSAPAPTRSQTRLSPGWPPTARSIRASAAVGSWSSSRYRAARRSH